MARLPTTIRRLLLAVALVPAALVALAALAVLALTQTAPGRALVLEQVLSVLNTQVFAATIDAERLAGPVFGRLALERVQLAAHDEPGAPMLATLDRVEVRYDIRALIRGAVVIEAMAIDGLHVTATIDAAGTLDLASVLQPANPQPAPAGDSGIALRFDDVQVRESSFTLRDDRALARGAGAVTLAATSMAGALSFAMTPDGALEARVTSLETAVSLPNWVERAWAFRVADVRFASEGDRLDVAVAEVHVDDAALIGFDGTVTLAAPESPLPFEFVNLSFPRFALAPDELNGALGAEVLLAPIRFGARVSGPPSAVEVEIPVEGPEGRVELGITLDVRSLANPRYEGLIRLVRVRPGAWLSLGELDADVSAALYVRGAGLQPDTAEIAARLEVGPSRVGPLRIDEAFVATSWAEQVLTLSSLQLRSRGAELDAQGVATLDGVFDLGASLEVPDIAETLVGVGETFEASGLPDASGALSLDLQASGAIPLAAWRAGELPTTLDEWSTALAAVTASIRASTDNLAIDGNVIDSASMSLTAAAVDGQADVTADVRVRDVVLAGTNNAPGLRIPSGRLDVRWADDAVNGTIAVAIPSLVGDASASFRVTDSPQGVRARIASLRAQPLGIDARLLAPLSVDVALTEWRPTSVQVRDLQASLDAAQVEGDMLVQLTETGGVGAVEARIAFREVAVDAWAERLQLDLPVAIEATFEGALEVDGALDAPRLALTLGSRSVAIEQVPAFELATTARLASGRATGELRATPVDPDAPALSIREVDVPLRLSFAPFAFALDEAASWGAAVEVSAFPLGLLEAIAPPLAAYGIDGSVVMAGALSGTPEQPIFDGTLNADDVAVLLPWGEEAFAFDALAFALDAEVRTVDRGVGQVDVELDATWQGQPLASAMLDGTLDLGALLEGTYDPRAQPLRASLAVAPFDITRLPEPLLAAVGADTATVQAAISWNGTMADPGVKVTVVGADISVGAFGPFRVVTRVTAADRLELAALLYEGDADSPLVSIGATHAQAFARALSDGIDQAAALEVNAAVNALPAASLSPLVSALRDETAVASGTFRVAGSLDAPRVDGSVSLEDIRLVGGGVGDLIAEVMVGDAATDMAVTMLVDQQPVLTLDASVQTPLAGASTRLPLLEWPLSARLQATSAPLERVVPELAASELLEALTGVLDADIQVAGTIGAPTFSGGLVVEDAGASVIPLGRTFEGVRLAARVDDSGLVIDEIRLGDADGFVTGAGRVLLDGLAIDRYTLGFRFRDLFVADPSGQGVNLRGVVDVEGRMTETLHDVEVVLRDMRVTVPDNSGAVSAGPTRLPDYIHFVDEDVAESEVGQALPRLLNEIDRDVAPATPLRVHVTTTGNNELRHPLIEVTFAADVTLEIDGPQTRTSGQVTILSGGLSVASNRFEIERGFVRFTEAADAFDPMVDVVAVHALAPDVTERVAAVYGPPSGDSATIRVGVTGLVSELTANIEEAIRLSSDPGMNRQDIFQVLATGRLSGSGDSSEAQEGVAALSGLLIGLVSDRIRETLFIDTLRIEGTSETQRIEGGKYIADNLYISGTYIRTPDQDDDNNFEVALQWILREIGPGSLRFELRGGDRAKGGVELLYQVIRRARAAE